MLRTSCGGGLLGSGVWPTLLAHRPWCGDRRRVRRWAPAPWRMRFSQLLFRATDVHPLQLLFRTTDVHPLQLRSCRLSSLPVPQAGFEACVVFYSPRLPIGARVCMSFRSSPHVFVARVRRKEFRFLIGFLGLPAGFPSPPDLFQGLRFCGGVSVDRNLLVAAHR